MERRIDIEARVICGVICEPSTIPDVREIISAGMFQSEVFADLWRRASKAWDSGHPLDENVFMEVDADTRHILADAIPQSVGVLEPSNNARTLRLMFADSLMMSFIEDMSRKLARGLVDSSEMMAEIRSLSSALEICHSAEGAVRLSDAVQELEGQLAAVRKERSDGRIPYIKTGFDLLDYYFKGGLRDGNVMVMAARPGVGKTATLLAMIKSAVSQGKKVRLYSLEMPAVEIAERIMYSLGALDSLSVRTGDVDKDKWGNALRVCEDWGLWISTKGNIDDIVSDASVWHQRGECDIVFIDHLRLLKTGDKKTDASIYARTCELTRRIKNFALGSMLPVVYACQLNRDSVREDREPDLQDLRDSGSIEEDADRIVFLQRLKTENDGTKLKMIIGKNRQGGGVYEYTYLIPNETYTVFTETKSGDDILAYKDPVEEAIKDLPY